MACQALSIVYLSPDGAEDQRNSTETLMEPVKSLVEPVNSLVESHSSLSRRIGLIARRRCFETFQRRCRPDEHTTILDIGATEDDYESANVLEKLHPWPRNITCATLGDGQTIMEQFPEVRHVSITPGARLPFPDRSFDISYSNAVLEHVGDVTARRFFISEALRVASAVFFVVPNKWFPVEHHTGIPLLHWAPRLFRSMLAGGKYRQWSRPENLDFLSVATLRSEWVGEPLPLFEMTGLPLGPMSSNFTVLLRR